MTDLNTRGRCTNLPENCSLAKSGALQEMPTPDTVCSECGSKLLIAKGASPMPPILNIAGGIALLLLVAGILFWSYTHLVSRRSQPVPGRTASSDQPAAKEQPDGAILPSYLLRLSGSNTIGGRLVPDLAEAWMLSLGATDIEKVQRVDDNRQPIPERVVSGMLNGSRVGVEIKAHGTGTGVDALANGDADIWMASAPATDAQVATLASVGNMRAAQSEHVIGLDGIAVIVSPSNALTSLSKAQVKAIFSGAISDWSQIGQPAGHIELYARDKESGTRKMFEEIVLGKDAKMAPLATRMPDGYDDSDRLSDDVVADPHGIGFIGMSYIKSAKALAINDGQASALSPTIFTVRNENYVLSRRLFLYTTAQPKLDVTRFLTFALGETGQVTVQKSGFVNLTIVPTTEAGPCRLSSDWPGDPEEFCRLRTNATAFPASFRFLTGSSELDNLARQNLSFVLDKLRETPDARLILAGFADSRGDYPANCRLSKQRADAVARGLATLGISNVETRGYCEELPVRDNFGGNYEGNRRVEIFASRTP